MMYISWPRFKDRKLSTAINRIMKLPTEAYILKFVISLRNPYIYTHKYTSCMKNGVFSVMDFCEIKHLILHLYIRITLDIHKYIITYTALKSGFFFRTGIKDFVFLKIFLKKRRSAMQAHLICTRSLIIRIYKCSLFDRAILNFAAFWPLETKYRVTHIPILND